MKARSSSAADGDVQQVKIEASFTQPTIFSEIRPDMRIAREEIFGPVLVIIPYRDEEEAIAIANDTVYGLGAHVQSPDPERARQVASRIRAGQVHELGLRRLGEQSAQAFWALPTRHTSSARSPGAALKIGGRVRRTGLL
nr:aldehyde dehydrogenase family protein [Sinorhizobium alkalisoli]